MLRYFLFGILATSSLVCFAVELKDPEAFIKDSLKDLNDVRAKCEYIADDLEKYADDDLEEKADIARDLAYCEKKMHEIASVAAIYELEKIKDVRTRETIINLQNIDERYKMGEKLLDVGHIWKELIDTYNKEDIEYYDDSDVLYSMKEIDAGKYITRTEDINEINYYWSQVANKMGTYSWANLFEFVGLIQKKAKDYNMTAAEYWYPNYSEELMSNLENIMKELKIFYAHLHAYMRFKLLERYGAGVIKPNGPIPESLYKQIEDRIWHNDNHYEEDFPQTNLPDFQEVYEVEEIDTKKLLEMAEEFYTSMGFEKLPKDFKDEHIKSIEDARTFDDKRANNLTLDPHSHVTFERYVQFHEYFGRMYSAFKQKDLPWIFWHENVIGRIMGQAVKLAAATKKHAITTKMMSPTNDDTYDEWMLNTNVRLAFQEMFDLSRGYVNMRLVTELLNNKVEKDAVNKYYWELFDEFAGVEPPIDRNDESLDLPYTLIRDVIENKNLISEILTTIRVAEVFKAACHRAKHTGPLHECDFYGDKQVGEAFMTIMATRLSKPYNVAIEPLIPDYKQPSGEALLAYFEPTFEWMKRYSKKHNLTLGWANTKKTLTELPLTSEEEAIKFVEESSTRIYELYDQIASELFKRKNEADEWTSDYGDDNFWKVSNAATAAAELTEISLKAKKYDVTKFKLKPMQKAIWKLAQIADLYVLGQDMHNVVSNNKRLYNLSSDNDITKYKDESAEPETVQYNPYILNVFRTSKDAKELKYYWEAWRDLNGAFAKALLMENLKSFEKAANISEISTTAFWFKHYSDDYVKKMEKVVDAVKPFYKLLHAYVKQKLLKKYSKDDFSLNEAAIPDHFAQQVLLQIWTNESIVEDDFPYTKLPPYEQGFDAKKFEPLKLLKNADEFYQSLGFEPFDETFWTERVKQEEGSAADGSCHATIFDMTPKVYMKYCERVSFRKFLQAHGYMGRVHYAVEKKDLPAYYFDSYDFEYPVGEAIVLSAASPKHMEKLGLFSDFKMTDEVLLNRLIRMAIHTMFNLHRYFVHTKLIAEYLDGTLEEKDLAKTYWNYMITIAGIEPPSDRNDDTFDFPFEFYTDLEKNHQVKKFVSEVLGYRMYERLCKLSGHTGDLNNCDFFGSTEAGNALKSMMKLGSSLPRTTVLKRLLQDVTDLNANAMLSYYEPLKIWLKNKVNEDDIDSFDSYRKYIHTEYFA